jgi:hypothetical protein
MKGQFLIASQKAFVEGNIYADRSALVLDWILRIGVDRSQFAIREVVRDRSVSVGLVQKVFEVLVMNGFLQTVGVRTAKRFTIKKPELLLKNWLDHYSIVKKCKMRTYKTGFSNTQEVLKKLMNSDFKSKVALSLHAAAEVYGTKNTNLQTLELYLLDSDVRHQLEEFLQLEPQERGYEILLIEPYYKSLLKYSLKDQSVKKMAVSPTLLTFLDLYHFPLRGIEQAEFMAERLSELKRIYKKDQ